jgi:cobyrinic acid a,c-diamide synthase
VIYAEGGAVAYLCRRATCAGETFEMAGVIPGNATLIDPNEHSALQANEGKKTKDLETKSRVRYCSAKSIDPSPLGPVGTVVKGTRDYRWNIRLEAQVQYALELKLRGSDSGAIFEGLMPTPSVVATSAHLHWASNPTVANSFIRAALLALGLEETAPTE